MNQRLRDIIEFETFLFHGVSEHKRRRPAIPDREPEGEVIEQITLNTETGELIFKPIESRKETKQ